MLNSENIQRMFMFGNDLNMKKKRLSEGNYAKVADMSHQAQELPRGYFAE
jgi:hypothetical protein